MNFLTAPAAGGLGSTMIMMVMMVLPAHQKGNTKSDDSSQTSTSVNICDTQKRWRLPLVPTASQ